ncbi:aminoglycoside phosphotransferase family protein [Mariprofundus micogutta]|uniref:aminoglycoside phosphotransferase family protein n=1 Tax=Mariprofundus micogutta TaxID=1921010 RepID=UPI000933EB7A|nr:phosphotransferase [Mariprofundus micogutta]
METDRAEVRGRWLRQQLSDNYLVAPLAGDASFRRYFRVKHAEKDYVLMDAPPPHEDVSLFLAVRDWFERAGLRVSALYGKDIEQGFLLLEDFGDMTWSSYYAAGKAPGPLFDDALRQLQLLQASQPGLVLPQFDVARMQRECDLYLDWYLPHVAGVVPTDVQRLAFHQSLRDTLSAIASLPQVPVHLDYHSRNLMLPGGKLPLGQIDYQDAVRGPVTYDLASLLYDCYQDYPETERFACSAHFFESLPAVHSGAFSDVDEWHRLLRLTALQRHIKAIGIFGRLAHRDGKSQFLDEIPLTRKHLHEEMQVLGMKESAFPLLYIEPVNR